MRTFKMLVVVTTILVISSCKKNEDHSDTVISPDPGLSVDLSPEEYLSIAYDHPRELSENEIGAVVKNFIQNKKLAASVSGKQVSVEGKSFVSLNDKALQTKGSTPGQNIPVYKVKITDKQNKDVAFVSGDERYPVVMAYYGAGEEQSGADAASRLLVEAATELLKHNINNIEHLRDSLRPATLARISRKLSIEADKIDLEKIKDRITINGKPRSKAVMVTDPSTLGAPVSNLGPYLWTRWSIGMPYNRQMAQSCPNNWLWDNRYAISSVAVATAQILAYYMPGMSMNGVTMDWNYLTENQEIHEDSDYFGGWVQDPLARRDMVAHLMKGIGNSCGITYTCTGSSVNFTNVRNFLNSYGIVTGNQTTLNVPLIKTSIENLQPVYVYGQTDANQGHWWVIDGAYITTGNQSYIPGYNFYLHANMGQGKSYAGYYLVGVDQSVTFNASFAHFTKNFQVYPNVTLR